METSILNELTDAYFRVTYGYDEPDVLRVSIALKLKLVEQDWYVHVERADGRITSFMNCVVKPDPKLKDGEFWFENSGHPAGSENWEYFRTSGKVEL